MEKTCGNCEYHEAEIFRNCVCKASSAYRRPTHPDAKACEFHKQSTTLEQRYQQLEQVARGMLEEIKTMAGSYGYTADLDYEHKYEWIEDCVRPWREKLEELGVEL